MPSSGQKYLNKESRIQETEFTELKRPPLHLQIENRQLHTWTEVKHLFNIQDDRYLEFEFLLYLDIYDSYVRNYVFYLLNKEVPLIVGRLKKHVEFWKSIKTPEWILEIILHGFKVPFLKEPPVLFFPNNKSAVDPKNRKWVLNTLAEFESYGFIKRVDKPPYCILPLSVAEHPEKLSLIHDESPLNIYVDKTKFKLEGWDTMFEYAKHADYGIKFDLKKFYFHIEIHEDFKKYFGFSYQIEGETVYFIWNTLPYGYTRAPYIAKHLMKPLVTYWRYKGFRITVTFDDGFCVSSSFKELRLASLQIQSDLVRAGLIPGLEKCTWLPSKKLSWNGLYWNLCDKKLQIMERRITNFLEHLQFILNSWPLVSFRTLSKLIGMLISMYPVFCGKEQLFTRYLQTFINIRNYHELDWDSMIKSDFKELFSKAKFELEFWLQNIKKFNERSFFVKAPIVLAWSDASSYAIGGIAIKMCVSSNRKIFQIDDCLQVVQGDSAKSWHVDLVHRAMNFAKKWPEFKECKDYTFYHRMLFLDEKELDSNERELKAVKGLLYGSKNLISNCSVTLHVDNETVESVIRKGSSKIRLHKYATEIFYFCLENEVSLNVVSIPRSINCFADMISKSRDLEDYTVTQNFFEMAQNISGLKCNVDRFANNFNTKLKIFNSSSFCIGTSGVDSFNYDWSLPFINWCFPPPRLISKTINKLRNDEGIGLLITPEWKSAFYYPLLIELKAYPHVKVWTFEGKNVFKKGIDPSSFFGESFKSAVNLWLLNFSKS